jgi:glycosyltransferase involved in cell wall biosynthesis
MTLSIVIPTWSGSIELARMALHLSNQVRGMCDELVISEDGGSQYFLRIVADTYLFHKRLGHAGNLRLGCKVASGDYIGMLDSDVTILEGTMRSLCIPNKFVCGQSDDNSTYDGFLSFCAVVDRQLLEKYPMPNGDLLDDWCHSIPKEEVIISDKVRFHHKIGVSYTEKKRIESLKD